MTFFIIGAIVVIIVLSVIIFLNSSPQFGSKPTRKQREMYAVSENYSKGKFINQVPTTMDMNFKEGMKVMREFMKKDSTRKPTTDIPFEKIDSLDLLKRGDSLTRLTWFGHSTILLEISGKRILFDPMFGEAPSPVPAFASKRFNKEMPIEIENLPPIDAIIISHDHYDHLDYESIVKLKDKTTMFYVPLGVAPHLISWGVAESKIEEMNWWQKAKYGDLNVICAPSRHFSGRGLTDRNTTLWSSWIIQSGNQHIYFSGDGGYGPHFKEIGEKYGPFDFAMMECGQYNERWEAIHMMPEQTVLAALDIKAKVMMPIHWGAFSLSLHSWTDPVERSLAEANRVGMPIAIPKIGQTLILEENDWPVSKWWANEQVLEPVN